MLTSPLPESANTSSHDPGLQSTATAVAHAYIGSISWAAGPGPSPLTGTLALFSKPHFAWVTVTSAGNGRDGTSGSKLVASLGSFHFSGSRPVTATVTSAPPSRFSM